MLFKGVFSSGQFSYEYELQIYYPLLYVSSVSAPNFAVKPVCALTNVKKGVPGS